MANISGLSASTNSAMSSLRGYGGLASGLDRDELIEGMTSGTQTKITKQEQAKTKLEWQQQAYRDISDKMISFANKYTATMSSSTNLFSEAFWGAASTTALGTNSKYIGVSGSSKTAAANVSILGVKQLARNTKIMSSSTVSDRTLVTGTFKTGDDQVSKLAGKNLEFKVGDKSYTVSLPYGNGDQYNSVKGVTQAINEAMAKISVNYTGSTETEKLSDVITVGYDESTGKFTFEGKGGNSVTLKGGTALSALGFNDVGKEGIDLKTNGKVSADNAVIVNDESNGLLETQSFAKRMGGKNLTFNYNGTSKTIEMPSEEEIAKAQLEGTDGLEFLQSKLQQGLDAAFGKGRVKAEFEKDDSTGEARLTFKTTTPEGQDDASSTISITDGSASLMATQGGMGVVSGESNRLNLNTSLKNSGLADYPAYAADGVTAAPVDGKYSLNINGKDIEFTENDSISSIMDKINGADAGVKISYMSMADKFVLESTEPGAGGEIKLSGNGAMVLFGDEIDSSDPTKAINNEITQGQDAIVAVKYTGSDEIIELHRGSNSFSIDGLNVTTKGVFGYDGDKVNEDINSAVTFETNVKADNMVSAISDLVKEYNEIVEMVNSQLSTRPDSDYFPLTDDQKKEMSESEIKLWEEKAKAGILFGSSELRSLSDDLRWAIAPKDQQAMEALGISVSSSWQDNGKLSFDETKFRAAIEHDPDAVKEAFTKSDGIASNLKNTMHKYVNTLGATKGILIEKAGSTHAPTSVLKNSLKTEIDDVDKILENLKTRLKSEQDRYISQFTQLETLISQMNSQSSYLSGLGF